MAAAKATGKAAVLEGMIIVIAGIVAARVMAYPCSSVHVRSIGMAAFVGEIAILLDRMRRAVDLRRAARWNRLMVLMVSVT
jgi:hypothetical protein